MSPGRALTISLMAHVAVVMAPVRPVTATFSPASVTAAPAALTVRMHAPASVTHATAQPEIAESASTLGAAAVEPALPPVPVAALPLTTSPLYYRSREVDLRAEPIEPPPIVISERAYLAGIQGSLRLRIYVSATGQVDSIDILSAEPPGVFEDAVLEAVTATRFEPARLFGRPVGNVKEIEIKLDPYETIMQP